MYSDKKNVNILTSLIVAHGVHHAVVCPGSRNAPIAHNLSTCPDIECYPVTDERSAGFFAIGMALATKRPVAVCVTSGSALLNLAPAVAEAHYQRIPLMVISADRPRRWIGQLDGQTLPQPDAFGGLVSKSVDLPENISTDEDRWYCNRLVNEALLAMRSPADGPVHVNVPMAEPLFGFSVPELPEERVITRLSGNAPQVAMDVIGQLLSASRPMMVIGQCMVDDDRLPGRVCGKAMQWLSNRMVILSESLTNLPPLIRNVDEVVRILHEDRRAWPDFILYVGGTLVSKPLRRFLRKVEDADVLVMSPDDDICDVTMHATKAVRMDVETFLLTVMNNEQTFAQRVPTPEQTGFLDIWKRAAGTVSKLALAYQPAYSQMAAISYFEQQLEDMDYDYVTHYANSSAVRLANIYAEHPVYCNRGVNGIDGSVSVAAGFSAVDNRMTFCVTGDLSFFYDQNALWNVNLRGNLRIILLNNGGGGIFRMLPGLEQSKVRDNVVCAAHNATAQGICLQNDVGYLKAHTMEEMQLGVVTLLTKQAQRPMLLEIFTDAETDAQMMKDYYRQLEQYGKKRMEENQGF